MITGTALTVGFFIISLRYPRTAYGLILALLPLYLFRLQILSIPTTALELMVGVFLFATLITNYNQASWKKIKKLGAVNYAIGGLVVAGMLSTIISPEPIRALGQLKAYFIEPILFFYTTVILFKNKKEFILPLKFLFWSATLISLFGIVQYWTHLLLPLRFWGYGNEVKRITSVFEYPNALALYLAPIFVFFLAAYFKGPEVVKRYWLAAGVVIMLVTLILTSSRGAWLAVMASIIVLLIKQKSISFKRWGAGVAILILLLSPLIFNRLKTSFNDPSSNERLSLYRVAVNKILDSPLLGNGLYGFRNTLSNSAYHGEILNYPHNILFNFWLEIGLLGVLSFLLIIFLSLQKYSLKPTAIGLAAALSLLAIFVHGMVDVPYFKNDLSLLFWSLISIFYLED